MNDFTWGLLLGVFVSFILFHPPARNKIMNYIRNRRQPAQPTKKKLKSRPSTVKKRDDNEIR